MGKYDSSEGKESGSLTYWISFSSFIASSNEADWLLATDKKKGNNLISIAGTNDVTKMITHFGTYQDTKLVFTLDSQTGIGYTYVIFRLTSSPAITYLKFSKYTALAKWNTDSSN